MAVRERFSVFNALIPAVRDRVKDIADHELLINDSLYKRLMMSITGLQSIKGLYRYHNITWGFKPARSSDTSSISDEEYQNYANVIVNYTIKLDDTTQEGYIESMPLMAYDMSIISIQPRYSLKSGSGTAPTLDLSLDKDIDDKDAPGSWIVADEKIPAMANGGILDVSGLYSRSLSWRWYFPANSLYEVDHLELKIFLVDETAMSKMEDDLVFITAADLLDEEVGRAAKDGQSEIYLETLKKLSEDYRRRVSHGPMGTVTPSSSAGSVQHSMTNTDRLNKAFGKKSSYFSVETRDMGGYDVIRIIDDNFKS